MNHSSLFDRILRTQSTDSAFAVINPANGGELAQVADMSPRDADRAINAAGQALSGWASKTAKERAGILRKWYELILANQEALAQILTAEQGKPLTEARGEILFGASFVEWFAEEGKRAYGDVIPPHASDKRLLVVKQPVGLVAAITPWNFPNAMITRKVAPALAAGCTVVIKPAEDTPLSALALAELAHDAGVPEDVLCVLTSNDPVSLGQVLTSHPDVRKLSFTGSTEVGKTLMSQCADTVKNISLELGGNAPFLVFDDADLDAAVSGAIRSKFRNAGQTCISTNRILVHADIQEAFSERFAEAARGLSVGDGAVEGNNVGPLINHDALEKVTTLVDDAITKGAQLTTGGAGAAGESDGLFFAPTVLNGITDDMALAREEIFGPVAPIRVFHSDAEAIELANDTPYGLAAYFYTRDMQRIWRISEGLEYGMVGVNEGWMSSEAAPFGGMKASGIGREGSKYGLEEFLEIKYICMGGLG